MIAIIAMLVGLLIPAVQRAREAGRRATCLNNQQQLGKAVFNYVTSKNKFPPLYTLQPMSRIPTRGPDEAVGWVPTMLTYIEQNPLYQVFQANSWVTANIRNAEVATLICPSRNPTFSPAPLSYVVNAGATDGYFQATPGIAKPLDFQENGIFFDDFGWRIKRPLISLEIPKPPTTDLAYLNKHDGAGMTLLLSENLDALDWITLPNTPRENNPRPQMANYMYIPNKPVNSWWQAITWYIPISPPPGPTWGMVGIPPTGTLLNKNVGATPQSDAVNGRPSSNHPGGFIVTMCDASSRFMSEDVEYRVYCLLMSPDSLGAKRTDNAMYGTTYLQSIAYPGGWRASGVLTPITAADLDP